MTGRMFGVLARRELAVLAGGLLGITVLAATIAGVLFAGEARSLLAVHFAVLPATATEAAGIWLHNLRSELGVAVFAFIDPACRHLLDGADPVWRRLLVGVGDVFVAGWAVGSSVVAGVLLGAYGMRQLEAFVPDGPVEVTAWLLLIVLYVDVRRGRSTRRAAAVWLTVIAALLAVAAVLELGAGT
jgi:hypothetical protein